jgi:transcriptional regulator MraZ
MLFFWESLVEFFGEHFKSLDDKGRVSIPKEFREGLPQAGLVVTKNMDGGLTVYPPEQWTRFVKRLEQCADGKQRTALNRLYLAPKTDVQLDRQGRIPLSKAQRKWAAIDDADREVVVVGNFLRIDIFSPEHYRAVVECDVELIRGDESLINTLDLP